MIRAGLIGVGKMGISHQAILNAHPDVDLVAICDASKYILDVLEKYTGIKSYTSYQEMIDSAKLDCVVVTAPTRFHGQMVRYALDRGLHVFCEKPFCLDVREGETLRDLALAKKLVNYVGYHNRQVGAFREAKRLVESGAIGAVHHIRAEAYGPVVLRPAGSTWRSSKAEGGGCLYDYASHAIDLVNYVVGMPSAVGGAILNKIFSRDVDDEVYASFRFAGGATGQIAANWSDDSHRKMSTKITIWGDNGRVAADRQECQLYVRHSAGSDNSPPGWKIRYTTELTEPVWYYLRGEEYSAQIDQFVRCIKSNNTEVSSSFATALEADKVIHAIVAAADAGWVDTGDPGSTQPKPPEKRRRFGLSRR
jgi:predicted dehydrogenase